MIRIDLHGDLITKWLTKGEEFPITKIDHGLPEGCVLRYANLRYERKPLNELRDPKSQPTLELIFEEPKDREMIQMTPTITTE